MGGRPSPFGGNALLVVIFPKSQLIYRGVLSGPNKYQPAPTRITTTPIIQGNDSPHHRALPHP